MAVVIQCSLFRANNIILCQPSDAFDTDLSNGIIIIEFPDEPPEEWKILREANPQILGPFGEHKSPSTMFIFYYPCTMVHELQMFGLVQECDDVLSSTVPQTSNYRRREGAVYE